MHLYKPCDASFEKCASFSKSSLKDLPKFFQKHFPKNFKNQHLFLTTEDIQKSRQEVLRMWPVNNATAKGCLCPLRTTLTMYYFSRGATFSISGGGSHRSRRTWPEVFCEAKNKPNLFLAGALPQTQTAISYNVPHSFNKLGKKIPFLFPTPFDTISSRL